MNSILRRHPPIARQQGPKVTSMAGKLPLLRGLSTLANRSDSTTPTMMSCSDCDVTWRDVPGAPCWFCGDEGEIANPKRLVLD